jgi:hydrogenase-4 component B
MEQDLKRILAFSSVENVGIIMMGVGLSLIFTSFDLPVIAALCMAAALFHLINHALFKGLLFMGAGSIQYSTGLKNIEEMGGLLKLMPVTGALFLIGALAISALPPLNGFASEWLTFQAILKATLIKDNSIQLLMLLSIPALALTGGLAVATFTKAFGISFLAIPRSEKAATAKEVPLSMNLGAGILAALCVLFGLGSGYFARIPSNVANRLLGLTGAELDSKLLTNALELKISPADLSGLSHSVSGLINNPGHFQGDSSVSLAYIAIALLFAALLAKLIVSLRGTQSTKIGATWDCGIPEVTPRMQYSALALSRPLKVVFRAIYRPHRTIEISDSVSLYYPKSISYRASISHVLEQQVYRRIVGYILKVAGKARMIQGGNINMYLVYIFVTLIAVILFAWR